MTVTFSLPTVTDSISKLDISGVDILDIDQIPASYSVRPQMLAPKPDDFITGLTITRDSFGTGGAEKMTATYTLAYRYYHTSVGNTLTLTEYANLIMAMKLILEAFLTNDAVSGLVDLSVESVSSVGPVNDPAGNMYHGFDITLRITEFVV